jgi:hypothetical protein
MKPKSIRKLLLIVVTAAVLLAALGVVKQPEGSSEVKTIFRLQSPPFVSVASAEEGSIASVIEDEAGMSAYFDAGMTIDLDNVLPAFRTIEVITDTYIIGSVEVENYPESEDVHVYVHVDGWILAYYLAADPMGKIYDWRAYHDSGQTDLTTKLENTLIKVKNYAAVPYPGCTYYDFRYPNATNLMLIADWVAGTTDSFEVNLPSIFTFDEYSWSLGTDDHGWYKLDGETIAEVNCNAWCTSQGTFTYGQLLPDEFHTIEVWGEYYNGADYAYAGLALVYMVP